MFHGHNCSIVWRMQGAISVQRTRRRRSGGLALTRGLRGLSLLLELLPCRSRQIIIARHRVGIDRRRDVRVGVTEALADVRQRDAGREQVRTVRVEAGALGQFQTTEK